MNEKINGGLMDERMKGWMGPGCHVSVFRVSAYTTSYHRFHSWVKGMYLGCRLSLPWLRCVQGAAN